MKGALKTMAASLLLISVISGCGSEEYFTEESPHDSAAGETALDGDEIYDGILNKLSNGDVKFSFSDVEEEDIIKEYKRVVREHPELFWIGDGYSYETITDKNGKTVNFECAHMSVNNIDKQKKELDSVVESILKRANGKGSLYEKITYIHDYIVDNTQYDKETYKKISNTKISKEMYEATTAYGCLVSNKAVCSGYSAAFQLLMQELGVQSGRVSGRKTNGESHEWNYILLDGDYYYVDVTWDDPISESSDDSKTHEFFCITTDELEETHEMDSDQFIPKCTATKYDYYIYNDLYLDRYDYDEFERIFENNDDDKIAVKFSSEREVKKAIEDLIEGQKIYDMAEGKRSCSYSTGSGGRVLSITMK